MSDASEPVAPRDLARAVVVAAIFVLFTLAYLTAAHAGDHDALTGFNGAILTAFAAAWGYFLGSSKGSADSGAVLRRKALEPTIAGPTLGAQTIVAAPAPDPAAPVAPADSDFDVPQPPGAAS